MLKIKELIISREISIREVALQMGVSEQYLSSVCCGKKKLSSKRLKQIREILQMTEEEYNCILKEYIAEYISKYNSEVN